MLRAGITLLLLVGAGALAACLAPAVDVEGKRCDLQHLCPEGYTCVVDACHADAGAADGG